MTFSKPDYARNQVRRAGECLINPEASVGDLLAATYVMNNWRSAHAYPLNTFQATLRHRLREVDRAAIVGQRLKRAPSILAKLRRFDTMKLHQMQDIAGLRAIVTRMNQLRRLHRQYIDARLTHDLRDVRDYVAQPKPDGYRSIHLVYRYRNPIAPEYDGLHVELQLRTKLQHAWATAVETVDVYLGEAIKAGNPSPRWAEFFKLASAAFARAEESPLPEEFAATPWPDIEDRLRAIEAELRVLVRLRGFNVATNQIAKSGRENAAYHLVILNTQTRTLTIRSFPRTGLEAANEAYARAEEQAKNGEPLDPVLVSGGSVDVLRRAYPNYFLDTDAFVHRIDRILNPSKGSAQGQGHS